MDNYITGKIIKKLREERKLSQVELANIIGVSDKAVSKWETGKGLPDISLIEPLAEALKVSIIELMSGEYIVNKNKASNMLKSNFSVCPICGNIIHTMGKSINFCCGINLPVLEAVEGDNEHIINCDILEDEFFVSVNHEMSKEHYISFFAYVTNDRCEIVKLYPQQNAEARFFRRGKGIIYIYCNKDGLVKREI